MEFGFWLAEQEKKLSKDIVLPDFAKAEIPVFISYSTYLY